MARVTEKKRVKIDRECKEYPVFATWINTLGGREQWLFHKNQTHSINTETTGTFEPFVEDLETARGQIFDISIFAQPQLTCYGLIDKEDLEGLQSILYSPNIEILVNPGTWETEGVKWQVYRVESGSFRIIDEDEVRAEFEIIFNKPYINNVSQ